ncbi:hypothetical protein AB0H07_39045 [Streptomyces sp. NPDC021354]|uniref:hypothetical protein n=1 Tax=Streptomyces sp. NPDC021354 TaxID=3154793 RepID=UPI00340AB17D
MPLRGTLRRRLSNNNTAAIMRAIAASPREFVCDRPTCEVAWRGEETDCWNCGLPATYQDPRRGSALERLLATVDSHACNLQGA